MEFILPNLGDNIIRTKEVHLPLDKHGLANMLFNAIQRHKLKIAQINPGTGRVDTYEDLLQKGVRVALEMKSRGINPDDIVCFCSENQMDLYVAYFAAILVGAVISALDPNISKPDIKHLLSQVPPKIIFVSSKCEEFMEEVLKSANLTPDIIIFGQTNRNIPFDKFLVAYDTDAEDAFTPHKVDDIFKTAIIFFSSGTTGLPKGICINHYSVMYNGLVVASTQENAPVTLGFSSPYWISSSLMFTASVLAGTARLVVPRFDIENLWFYIHKYKVNYIFAATSLAASMVKGNLPDGLNLSSLKAVLIGGSKVRIELLEALRSKLPGAFIYQGYGMTEIGGHVVIPDPQALKSKPTMCGTVRPSVWYKVVNPTTEKILGSNEPGELRLKSKVQMNGYYNLDSTNAWDSDGWLKTGDICYYDEDYCFYFVDRLKAVIKYRGIHVQSTILEDILLGHPAVEQAAVIGLPHPEDEEHPMAVLVLAANESNALPEDFRRYVDGRVDDPKKLRGGVKIVKKMPLTATGKINSRELKRQICEEMKIPL